MFPNVDLVAWWQLDETSGLQARDSWGGGYGTLLGFSTTPTWTNDTPGAASSGGLWFDGADDVINSGNTLASVSNAVTAEVWIKYWGVPDPVAVFLAKFQDANNRWYQRVNPGNTILGYAAQGGAFIDMTTSAVVPVDTWLHLVFTATRNGTCHWYVNGEENVNLSVGDRSFANTALLLIGAYSTGGSLAINAIIDDVRVYNRALTAEEVKQNYRVTIPGPPAGSVILVN